jgi:hypothetical protein
MPIDPYSPCPGGTGKKIKFCCSDLGTELDKIQRMLEGDQRAACLDHIRQTESKYPDRACLLSIKAMLQAQMGDHNGADQTVARFVEKHPDNPVALAERATLVAREQGGAAAIPSLQDALDRCSDQIPAQVYDAIGLVAQALIAQNHLFAARAHLVLQVGMTGAQDQQPLSILMRLNSAPSVPLLAKQDLSPPVPPDGALWKSAYSTAIAPSLRGAWRQSVQKLTELAEKAGDWPPIVRAIAAMRTWLAETPEAIAAWRKYAAQSIPLDDAVEAEALAQLMDEQAVDMIDVLSVEFGVGDMEVLISRLSASPRAVQMPMDLSRMGTEDQPPPKAGYWLLSREVPARGDNLTAAEVPQVVGQAFLYGKQTDRDARLELATYRPQLADAQATLSLVAGDALGASGAEEVRLQIPALEFALTTNWRLPDNTPSNVRVQLIKEQRRNILLNEWPAMPRKLFGGKSAEQAAADPALKVPLLASILLLELSSDQIAADFDFNELRAKLGLPQLGTIEPAGIDLSELPLARIGRVDVKKVSDEDLVDLYRRADMFRHITALRKLALEVIARPSLDGQFDKAEVYGVLAQIEPDGEQAFKYLDEARQISRAAKKSTAPWDLTEFAMRIARGEVAEADRLMQRIRTEHIHEPGVAQALYQILADAGIIGPDGRPAMLRGAAPREGADIVVPGGAAEPGKLWTPDSDQPTGSKSKLWTPD